MSFVFVAILAVFPFKRNLSIGDTLDAAVRDGHPVGVTGPGIL